MARSQQSQFAYATVYGTITIAADGKGITHVVLGDVQLGFPVAASAVANRAATEIQEYFAGKRKEFDVPLHPQGSAFQKEVWEQLQTISYGHELSAADVAAKMGKAGSYRSVGTAIKHNPISILIPSHRVTPIGHTREAKLQRALLAMEKKNLER